MAFNVYSSILIDATPYTGEQAFLVPSWARCVVRDIDVVTPDGLGAVVLAGVGDHAEFWAANVASSPLYTYNGWRGRQVITAGLQLVVSVTGVASSVRASGYLLALP